MPLTAAQALQKVEALYAELANRRTAVALTEDYYRGNQPLRFASDKWREYHAQRYQKFSDNWCAPVANSPAERLHVAGFRLDEDPTVSDTEKALWRDWQLNDMDAQSSQGFLHSITSARSYVIVWGDADDTPVATWERADQVIVGYDPERPRQRLAALKTWRDGDTEFATLYLPDEVWKWERPAVPVTTGPVIVPAGSRGAGFFQTPTGVLIPAPVVDAAGWKPRSGGSEPNHLVNPLGVVPVVEFPNRPLLGTGPLSDIAGTMAMQDAINLLWAYLFTAADFASMPARVVLGQEPPKIPILDENGVKVGERPVDLKKIAEDRILWLTGQNTKIGQWDAAALDVFSGVVEIGVTHIAAQTRTPPHYLILGKGMVNVNAEGMKAAEIGLVQKVGEEQVFFGPAVREVNALFALVRGQKDVADQARLGTVQWKDAENRSEAQLVDALQKLYSIGFPFPWIAERYGLSQTEVARLLEMRESQAAADPIAALARMQAQAGQPDPTPDPEPAPAGA